MIDQFVRNEAKDIRLLFTPTNRDLVRLGKKTETRRIMNPPPDPTCHHLQPMGDKTWVPTSNSDKIGIFTPTHHRSRYGCPQREPVRYYLAEPVQVIQLREGGREPGQWGLAKIRYLDDNAITYVGISGQDIEKLRDRKDWSAPTTAMFMLKSFARTWLTGVRVWPEPLGQMSDESAIAEGVKALSKDGRQTIKYGLPDADGWPGEAMPWKDWQMSPIGGYRKVWESINGPNSWDDERWVWVVKFELMGA